MNKRIKRIIAMTLIVNAFFTAGSVKCFNLNNIVTAYASTDDDDDEDEGYLDNIQLSTDSLGFSEKNMDYTLKLDSNDETETITATVKKIGDQVQIDGGGYVTTTAGSTKVSKTVKLEKGRNLIKVKVNSDYGIRTYNIVLNRGSATGSSSSSNDDNTSYLNDIELSDGDIAFSQDKILYDVNVAAGVDEIRITAKPVYDDVTVKINGIKVDDYDHYRQMIKLANGKNVILVEVEDENNNEKTYTLNINRGGTTEVTGVDDTTQDPIYLDDLVIQDGKFPIKFKPKVTAYATDVPDDWDSVLIKAIPEYYGDKVKVDGYGLKDPNVRRVDLKEGKNVIPIEVNNSNTYDEGDYEYQKRIYKLTIYRGTSEGTAASSNSSNSTTTAANNTNTTTAKTNQWVNINGSWQYNDALGNSLKNMWFNDISTGYWYYLDANGNMKTGWMQDGANWYYLYPSGGAMACNTTIDNCKLGSNGAWIR